MPQVVIYSRNLLQPQYRPDIDGLRAVAVLSVVLFHAFPGWIPGGFIGVDIFFVISGFLISTIILGSLEGKGFSYRTFYARRIRRIFPALALVMAATLAAGWFWLFPVEWRYLGYQIAGGAGFASNLIFWSEAGYFDTLSGTKVLLHLWSLAIEEQFYIVWPLLLGLVWWRKWPALPILAGTALASFAVNIALVMSGNSAAAFYAPWARAWELMAGGMLACLRLHTIKPWLPWSPALRVHAQSLTGIVLIVLGLAFVHNGNTFPGWWALLPVLGTVLCIAAGPDGWLNRLLLASPPMVWIGAISYPLYLWHWPLLVYARLLLNGMPSLDVRIGLVIASFVFAWLTYRFVEQSLRHRPGVPPVLGLCSIMAILGLSGAMVVTWRWQTYHANTRLSRTIAMYEWIDWPGTLTPAPVTSAGGQDIYRAGHGPRKVLLAGDSHLMMVTWYLQDLLARNPHLPVTLDFSAAFQCLPIANIEDDLGDAITPNCSQRFDAMFKSANSDQYDAIVLAVCWACYFLFPEYYGRHHYYDDRKTRIPLNTPEGTTAALRQLSLQISAWVRQHKKVYLMLNIPVGTSFSPVGAIKGPRWDWQNMHTLRTLPWSPKESDLNAQISKMAQDSGAQVLDPIPVLCHDGQCLRTLPDGMPIYTDGYHLRASYARQHAIWMDPVVAP